MDFPRYTEVVSPQQIKIRGHRVWIEHMPGCYLGQKMSVDALERRFSTLSRQNILAALLYYHENQTAMDDYMSAFRQASSDRQAAAEAKPQAGALRRKVEAYRAQQKLPAGPG